MRWLHPHYATPEGEQIMNFQGFIVQTPTMNVMLDTCIGNGRDRGYEVFCNLNSSFFDDLASLRPDAGRHRCGDVHASSFRPCRLEHVLGTARNGRRSFPKARYLSGKTEFAAWEDLRVRMRTMACTMSGTWPTLVDPIMKAGLADLSTTITGSARNCSSSRAMAARRDRAHLCIESKGERGVITGDLMHHPIQCALPHRSGAVRHGYGGGPEDPALASSTGTGFGCDGDRCAFRRSDGRAGYGRRKMARAFMAWGWRRRVNDPIRQVKPACAPAEQGAQEQQSAVLETPWVPALAREHCRMRGLAQRRLKFPGTALDTSSPHDAGRNTRDWWTTALRILAGGAACRRHRDDRDGYEHARAGSSRTGRASPPPRGPGTIRIAAARDPAHRRSAGRHTQVRSVCSTCGSLPLHAGSMRTSPVAGADKLVAELREKHGEVVDAGRRDHATLCSHTAFSLKRLAYRLETMSRRCGFSNMVGDHGPENELFREAMVEDFGPVLAWPRCR